jgi:hypothetical protein
MGRSLNDQAALELCVARMTREISGDICAAMRSSDL